MARWQIRREYLRIWLRGDVTSPREISGWAVETAACTGINIRRMAEISARTVSADSACLSLFLRGGV